MTNTLAVLPDDEDVVTFAISNFERDVRKAEDAFAMLMPMTTCAAIGVTVLQSQFATTALSMVGIALCDAPLLAFLGILTYVRSVDALRLRRHEKTGRMTR